MTIAILNAIIKGFASIVMVILAVLPSSPFTWDLGELSGIWGVANYFIPFAGMITLAVNYTLAVATWYGIRWILRFTRYIQ
ncbi:hypothetical protein Psfp_03422 [Pelotomaculum sp. FP]|uniref:hypothetical protein n=1 Tax=Pelotomaculum sp. FP TaxID=261474 RepID=UPI001064A6FF|nr:hypothetical protein [Pelotomaculum sp. FP]TEB13558.1 hypothetical protein Psfp_03422 [Pelotomaculum sp. FP]